MSAHAHATVGEIGRHVIGRLDASGSTPLSAHDLEDIRAQLRALAGQAQLRDAVRDLIVVAVALQSSKREDAAQPLFALVEEREVIEALDRVNADRAAQQCEAVVRTAKKFASFLSTDEPASAAPQRPSPPPGTMRLEDLGVVRPIGFCPPRTAERIERRRARGAGKPR